MKEILYRLTRNETLSRTEARQLMTGILTDQYPEIQTAALLMALTLRGLQPEELTGMREALCQNQTPIDLSDYHVLDIVGTGGDHKNTFNISTCSCLVVAGAGYHVAKHGNYAATSVCGASNVLETLGAHFDNQEEKMKRNLELCHFTYLHAPLFAPGMKKVAHLRQTLQIPTCFNTLGPLLHPAKPSYQLLGTANLQQMRLYDHLLQQMDVAYGIVNSLDGYDEISLTGDFKIKTRHKEYLLHPSDWHLPQYQPADLYGGSSPQAAGKLFLDILQLHGTPAQTHTVIANAGMAIQIRRPEMSIEDCMAQARESLESGRAYHCLKLYLENNRS